MRTPSSRKQRKPQEATPPAPIRNRRRFDPALLLYPACILAAMVVLYWVNDSIQEELPGPSGRRPAQKQAVPGDHRENPSPAAAAANRSSAASATSVTPSQRTDETTGPGVFPTQTAQGDEKPARSPAVRREDRMAAIERLQGADKIVALLAVAVEDKDHNRIKQCLAELQALGDLAVVGLNDLMNSGGEAGLWAAEALARIGTPMATSALLDTLAQTKEGTYKEELGRRLSAITNHDSWPVLLETMTQTGDATVARAASVSLARMADTPVLDEIAARYEAATTEVEMERLAQLVRNIQSPAATDGLLSLAGHVASTPQDSLQQAAVDALANVGDAQCLSHLMQRLEATTPGEGSTVYSAITRVSNPEARSQLLYAAAGNKEVSAEYGRTAAIEALKNYPSEETVALLERIVAQESNEKVVTAASRTLDDIKRAPHVITASAESLQKSEDMLPLKSVTK
jgi:HEAT repeat protein